MRKSIYYLLSLLAAAFLIVVILVWTAPSPNKQPNGFNRSYLQNSPLKPYTSFPTNDAILDIAGVHDSVFYFTVADDPAIIITRPMDNSTYADTFRLQLPQSLKDSMGNYFFTEVNGKDFFVFGYNMPAIYRTNRSDTASAKFASFSRGGFSQAHVMRDGKHILMRKLSIKDKDQFFVRVTLDGDSIVTENGLSSLHRDGGMSTDGSLNYDRVTGRFTYVYYYSNSYFSFDSAMHLTGRGNTIDTFRVSRLNVAAGMAKDQHVYINQGPDQMVNGFSCVNNGVLFVQAKLKADNDHDRLFQEHCVIDEYDLTTNRYRGSIYLDIPPRKVHQLFVHGDKLIVHTADSVYGIRINY
jgi:hypothetical protein